MNINKILSIFFLFSALNISAQTGFDLKYKTEVNISYIDKNETDSYRIERCVLDIYYPTSDKDYPTLVWFHGGGLEGGEKYIPEELKNKGFAVIAVNYRLSPKATNPAYIEDAAESIAWVFNNIELYGGNPEHIFVGGHSAGGYLALMTVLDKDYLQRHNINADRIKGLIPVSGQTNTHYTIRKERGIPMDIPIIDEYAPLNQARANIPSTLLITGDRNQEMTARYEENAHLEAILKYFGNTDVRLYEMQGFNHGTVLLPAWELIIQMINESLQ